MIKKILILEEHHGNRYFDVSTNEQLKKVCLFIVKDRYTRPEYQEWMDDNPEPVKPALSLEESQALPNGKVKDMALKEWEDYHRSLKRYTQHKRNVARIREAIQNEDDKLAYHILDYYRGWEDEGFEIVEIEDVT